MTLLSELNNFLYPMDPIVVILYKNYRGEVAYRRIVPGGIRFASTEYHPEPQWLLDAYDIDKDADRSFAVKDIMKWTTDKHGEREDQREDRQAEDTDGSCGGEGGL